MKERRKKIREEMNKWIGIEKRSKIGIIKINTLNEINETERNKIVLKFL